MTIPISKQTVQKIINLLARPEDLRDSEQNHFLYMVFKKPIKELKDINNWWMKYKCIENLEIKDNRNIDKQNICFIYVLKGEFNYFGMVYRVAECMQIQKGEVENLHFKEKSVYAVLTLEGKQMARKQSDEIRVAEQKLLVRGVLFESKILNKEFNNFWSLHKTYQLDKGKQLPINEVQDMIFIVIEGSIVIKYNWRRTIKLRQMREGSIFSTYLGRYFYRTGEQLKNMQRIQFSYEAKQPTLIFGFSADIFYEQERLKNHKYVVNTAWKLYLQRVNQTKRIIDELGTFKPEKQEVIKNVEQQIELKYLKQKIVSIPVAIERRKFRKIAHSLYNEKSNRRKVPNLANTRSVRHIKTELLQIYLNNPEKNDQKFTISTNCQSARNLKTQQFTNSLKKLNLSSIAETAKTESLRQNEESMSPPSKRPRTARFKTQSPYKKQLIQTLIDIQPKSNTQNESHFYRFFRPDEFISKKLKNHYESLIMNKEKIILTADVTQSPEKIKKYKFRKQQFEEYINQRRIMKLGPKKRILHKNKLGF